MSSTIKLSISGWHINESSVRCAPALDAGAAAEKVLSCPTGQGEWFDSRPGALAVSRAHGGGLEVQGEYLAEAELAEVLDAFRCALEEVIRIDRPASWAGLPGGEDDLWPGGIAL